MGFDELYESLKDGAGELDEMPVGRGNTGEDYRDHAPEGGEEVKLTPSEPSVFNAVAAGECFQDGISDFVKFTIEDYRSRYPDGDFSVDGDFYKVAMEGAAEAVGYGFGGEPAETNGEEAPPEMDGEGAQGEEGVNPEKDVEEVAEKPNYKTMEVKKNFMPKAKAPASAKKDPPAAKKE